MIAGVIRTYVQYVLVTDIPLTLTVESALPETNTLFLSSMPLVSDL